MGNYFESLQGELGDQLERAAVAYLKTGLSLFHVARKSSGTSYQPAVGNLCIAVELLLKTLIARKAFRFLYADIPQEAQVYLSYPETVPDAAAFRRYAIDLKGFKYKTPELDACISLFYTFFPAAKREFQTYLSLLSRVRNRSVHAALPVFQTYELYRVAYTALKLFQHLERHGVLGKWAYVLTVADKEFLREYDAERVERVEKEVEAAKKKTKKSEDLGGKVSVDGSWEHFTTVCSVCGSGGILYGSTNMHGMSEEDASLDFDAYAFQCVDCGFELYDVEELKIAGMDTTYDRNEDWDDWMEATLEEEDY